MGNTGRENMEGKPKSLNYLKACLEDIPQISVPEGLRIPFGWGAVPIAQTTEGSAAKFRLTGDVRPAIVNRLRITVALDVREEKLIEVFLTETGRSLGIFDIRYAYVFQPFELVLNQEDVISAIEEGISFRMLKGELPLWIFYDEDPDSKIDGIFLPHLLIVSSGNVQEQFHERMASLASVQIFGWMEGCVLDGLMDLASVYVDEKFKNAAVEHLNMFFPKDRGLVYENARSVPFDSKIYGIEATLPYAAFCRLYPEDPVLDRAVEFWMESRNTDGAIQDGDCLSAEGSYTVAYPLAAVSAGRKNKELERMAVEQLLIRRDRLVWGGDVHLRYYDDGHRTFKNWARAYAWYLLGLIRTVEMLDGGASREEIGKEFIRAAEAVLGHQLGNGLWACFVDEPQVPVDTSGSAGIAAAAAKGYLAGLLPESAFKAAEKALTALWGYLTPDGLLTGVAQSNRGGEELQRSSYRVISQMGMGLMAQLEAAVLKGSKK